MPGIHSIDDISFSWELKYECKEYFTLNSFKFMILKPDKIRVDYQMRLCLIVIVDLVKIFVNDYYKIKR